MKIAGIHIRKVVICFSLFIAFMLYQTATSPYGALVAIATLSLTLVSVYLERPTKVVDRTSKYKVNILIFILVIVFSTILHGYSPISSVYRFVLQALVCSMLFGVSLSEDENRYIKYILEISALVYSLLIIKYCLTNGSYRNIHGDIEMFGTSFDPNYIGIPLVAACILLLDNILKSSKSYLKIMYATAWITIVFAIIQTSSRGNAVSFAFGSICILYNYIRSTNVSLKKILFLTVMVVGLVYAFKFLNYSFGDNISRMTSFGEGADSGRFELWKQSIQVFFDNIIWGTGLGGVAASTQDHCSHNTYLQILAETGLVGFCLFVPVLVGLLKKAFRYDRVIFSMVLSMYLQIVFLNALDNRCVWAILGWIIMLPDIKYS